MKFFLSLLLIALSLCLTSKDGFTVIKTDVNSITVEYNFSGFEKVPVIIDGNLFYKLSGNNCVPILMAGFPELLRSSISLAIPNNAIPKLEIISSDFYEINAISIAPSKGSLKRDINPANVPYTFDNIYTQNSFYPKTFVEINSTYFLRHQKGVSLSILPIQANPVSKKLQVLNKLVFRISYFLSNEKKIAFNTPSFTSNEEKEIMTNRFLNLSSIQANAKVQYTPISEFGDMLVISDPAFISTIQPLVDWKNQKGIKTNLVSSVITGTTYTQVRSYIQNYYATNPNLLYVLIVGDHEQINAYDAGPSGSETKWSDSYYGLLNGNDHYPEIMIGRFSSNLASDITTMVDRTLEYEKTPLLGSWYTKGIGIGSNQGYGIGDEGEADWQHIRKIGNKLVADGYTYFHEFYDSTHAGNDAPGDPYPAIVANAVDSGASLFLYCGHGSQNVCVTSNYSSSDIAIATNHGMYPFSIQVACNNGTFIGGTCLSEAFLRAKNASGPTGAIASAGSSILMAWAEPMDTEDEIGDIVSDQYVNNKKYTLGGLFYNAQMHMLDAYPTSTGEELMETWVLFGDPSCMFRSLNPTTITASHAQCLLPNATTFSIASSFGPNTYASISQNNQIIGTAPIISANTNIVLTQTYSTIQNLILTITEYNKIPYIANLTNCIITDIKKENVDFANFFIESLIKDELTVNYKNVFANELNLVVFDLEGKLMLQSKYITTNNREGILRMNVSNLVAGVYLVKVIDNNNLNLKVVKVMKD